MEQRKLVKSGLSSFTMALPKDWVTRHKLGKKSVVFVAQEEDRLVIYPKAHRNIKSHDDRVLQIDAMPLNQVGRNIIAMYLENCGTITIKGKKLRSQIFNLKEIIKQCAGLEVIEETGETLVLKDFIDINEINLPNILHRNDNIIRSMFIDLLSVIEATDRELSESVRQRDKEVNKLNFLVCKCLAYLSSHPHDTIHHGIRVYNLMHIWQMNSNMEKVADEIKRMCKVLPNAKISKPERALIKEVVSLVYEFYKNVMTALYTHDPVLGDEYSSRRAESFKKCDTALTSWNDTYARQALGRIKYMVIVINDLSRLVHYVKFEKPIPHESN